MVLLAALDDDNWENCDLGFSVYNEALTKALTLLAAYAFPHHIIDGDNGTSLLLECSNEVSDVEEPLPLTPGELLDLCDDLSSVLDRKRLFILCPQTQRFLEDQVDLLLCYFNQAPRLCDALRWFLWCVQVVTQLRMVDEGYRCQVDTCLRRLIIKCPSVSETVHFTEFTSCLNGLSVVYGSGTGAFRISQESIPAFEVGVDAVIGLRSDLSR